LLPSYVGALPPDGVEPWDWERTWRMPAGAKLLTVSQRPEKNGNYRTIGAALKDAIPWATLRIVDAATYEEAITLDDPKRFEGVSIEAVAGATLRLPPGASQGIALKDVPHVRVAGLHFRAGPARPGRAFLNVSGAAAGLTLTGLDLAADHP